MKKIVVAAFAASMATAASAQEPKMLTDGAHIALEKFENRVATFAYRRDPKGSIDPGKWETLLSMDCQHVTERGAFISALQQRLALRADLPDVTGADWTALENDLLKGTEKLHDLCNASSSLPSGPKEIAQKP